MADLSPRQQQVLDTIHASIEPDGHYDTQVIAGVLGIGVSCVWAHVAAIRKAGVIIAATGRVGRPPRPPVDSSELTQPLRQLMDALPLVADAEGRFTYEQITAFLDVTVPVIYQRIKAIRARGIPFPYSLVKAKTGCQAKPESESEPTLVIPPITLPKPESVKPQLIADPVERIRLAWRRGPTARIVAMWGSKDFMKQLKESA
jgi:hypothetical protein